MTANDSFFQKKKPAAVLKHAVLREYLNVFCSMVGKSAKSPVWLVDGYAGPGMYEADSDSEKVIGSPLVALEIAETSAARKSPRDIRCAFIEQDQKLAGELEANVQPFRDRGREAVVLRGDVQARIAEAWQLVGNSPVLTLLDPFGVSMSKDVMTGTLLARQSPPSEVLLNINIEAVLRLGGGLTRDTNGSPVLKPGAAATGIEKVDAFVGGEWWRDHFLTVREQTSSAPEAAATVVDIYRRQVEQATGTASMSVPIRRRPNQAPLFLLTLFYRHPVAGYKFADAAARATRKWRDVYRRKDLDDFFGKDAQEMLPIMGHLLDDSESRAKDAEKALEADNVAVVAANIELLLAKTNSIDVAKNISSILGDSLSLAGEPVLHKAWAKLAANGVVDARVTSTPTWKQPIVKR